MVPHLQRESVLRIQTTQLIGHAHPWHAFAKWSASGCGALCVRASDCGALCVQASLPHDVGDPAYQLTLAHGGLYGPSVSGANAFNCGFGGSTCNTSVLFQDYFLNKTLEVVDGYSPDVLYFDSKWAGTVDDAHRLKFLAHYYNAADAQGKEVVVTYKQNDLHVGAGLLDLECGGSAGILRPTWQTDDSMDRHTRGRGWNRLRSRMTRRCSAS
jgi:hypothetical protein